MESLPNPYLFSLTEREWLVLLYVAADLTNTEIADKLFIQHRSVITVRFHIGDKLNLKGRNTLAIFARKHKSVLNYWFKVYWGKSAPSC